MATSLFEARSGPALVTDWASATAGAGASSLRKDAEVAPSTGSEAGR